MKQSRPERFLTFFDASNAHFDVQCLVVPWLRLLTQRLKYTLLEFWMFSIVVGVSIGQLCAHFERRHALTFDNSFISIYLACHVHAAFFSAVGEALFFKETLTPRLSIYRLIWLFLTQLPPIIIFSITSHF